MLLFDLLLVWMVCAVFAENATRNKMNDDDPGPLNCIRLVHSHTRRFMERAYRHSFMLDLKVDNAARLPEKRAHSTLYGHSTKPWLCSAVYNWVDLGHDYYPRFIKTASCPKISCWYGLYSCKPQPYTIKVLHRKSGNLKDVSRQSDILCKSEEKFETSSSSSQTLWEFKDIVISVHCDCAELFEISQYDVDSD